MSFVELMVMVVVVVRKSFEGSMWVVAEVSLWWVFVLVEEGREPLL